MNVYCLHCIFEDEKTKSDIIEKQIFAGSCFYLAYRYYWLINHSDTSEF